MAVLTDKELLVLQKLLTLTICVIERVKIGRVFVCTKHRNLVKILTETLYNKKYRKVILSPKQLKLLAEPKSPLCFDINSFKLISLTPLKYRVLKAEIISSNTAMECINALIRTKAIESGELKTELKELKGIDNA